jgi:hypothetical protein
MATLYLLAEEPVQNDQQQDCCLIVEVHAPDGIDNRWVQRAENAVKAEFGPGLRLWSADEHETCVKLIKWCFSDLASSTDNLIRRTRTNSVLHVRLHVP